ncbi:multidrug resistance-associated protein 1 [Favolaschia claudopus]|uniref:Multidrug resistance-associated protein 1 n=1 Tax=Favolaschia claudopus TaxID=2862362 RepID=A0AAW0BL75_9AGAR
MLCLAGTMYILPIIAAMGMRSKIAGAEIAPQDIVSLANALREVKHGQWFTMVQRFMIPINYIRTHPGYIQHLKLIHNPPDSQGQQTPVILSFRDEEKLDTIFDSIETQTYRLPHRSKEWMRTVPSWPKIQFADQVVLPRLQKIKTPLQLRKTKSPVTKSNRNQVTERERRYAAKAIPVASIKDLEDKVCFLSRRYIEINSKILNGEALHISDRDNNLVALLFSVPDEYRQMLIHALEHIHAVMPGELKDDDSRTAFFRYLSIHYVWYARFGESGSPASVHPDHLKKPNKGKVNVQQRMPRQSKELRDNHEEYALLADAFADFFDLIRVAAYLPVPEQYDEIKIVAESLPMGGGKSPAYPFTGFVLNVSSCTWAHRDGDKIMCFVIPLDKFIGGQLGQIETGFCFDLQMGDVLAFPSCDITHFNCHFTGRRVTLVLHTDPKGDGWAKDCNGWAAHVVTAEGGTSEMEA